MPKDLITGSLWEYVRPICTDKLGLKFDTWQDGIAGLALATRADGKLVHTVGGIGMSICRQTGKTFTVAAILFGLCIKYPGLLALWTAHHSTTSDETFLAMQGFADMSLIKPFIKRVVLGSGEERIEFVNGSRILFGAREHGFGRGIPGVDAIVNDEAQIMSQKAMENMLATMNTSWLGLHIYAGTPPKPVDNSEIYAGMRTEALAACDCDACTMVRVERSQERSEVTDIVWIEFGADDDADIDDQGQWAKANPSFPHRTPVEGIMRLRRRLVTEDDPDGFKREGLGIWDKEDSSVFNLRQWMDLKDVAAAQPDYATLVLDVSPDRRWSCIGIAGESDNGKTLVMAQSMRGTHKTVAEVKRLRDKRRLNEVAITPGAARAFETELVKESIEYVKISATDMSAAYNNFQKAIGDETICHLDQPELNVAIEKARTRFLQTGESEAFDRRGLHIDISPVVAVAAALYRWGVAEAPMPVIL
jgi:hypothetical protein